MTRAQTHRAQAASPNTFMDNYKLWSPHTAIWASKRGMTKKNYNSYVQWATEVYLHTQKRIPGHQRAALPLQCTHQQEADHMWRVRTAGWVMQRSWGLTLGLPTFCPSKCQKTDLACCTNGLLWRKGSGGRIFQVFRVSFHDTKQIQLLCIIQILPSCRNPAPSAVPGCWQMLDDKLHPSV